MSEALRLRECIVEKPNVNRSRFRFSLVGLFALTTLIAGSLGGCLALIKWSDGDDELTRFNCGADRVIVITAARSWEKMQPHYYYVEIGNKVVVPSTYFTSSMGNSDVRCFQLCATPDGSLVGVKDAGRYSILHDFSNNKSWPHEDLVAQDNALSWKQNNAAQMRSRPIASKTGSI